MFLFSVSLAAYALIINNLCASRYLCVNLSTRRAR